MNASHLVMLTEMKGSRGTLWYLSVPPALAKTLGLAKSETVAVRMGSVETWHLKLNPRNGRPGIQIPVRIRKTESKGFVLGPWIAILTSGRKGTFGGNRRNFSDIAETGRRRHAAIIVVTPNGLIKSERRIDGFVRWRNQWHRAVLPVPAVIYNRIPERSIERRADTREAKAWLRGKSKILFNPGFFRKDHIHEWCNAHPMLGDMLPETAKLNGTAQLTEWIRKFALLYVKPVSGKAGHRMMQIFHTNDTVVLIHQANGKRSRHSFSSIQDAVEACWKFCIGRTYVIQQGITLAKYKGCIYDLRVLVQKNRLGKWRVTGIGARVAAEDGITTHVPNGGSIASVTNVLRESFGSRARDIEERVRTVAITCASQIEKSLTGEVAELSIDIGVDQMGSLWIFEVNAKPMKFDEPYIRHRSLEGLVDFSEGIYGF